MLLQREAAKKGRENPHRMGRATDVVMEAREGQLLGASSATDGVASLEHQNGCALLGERDCRSEAVGAAANNDDVPLHERAQGGVFTIAR